MGMEYSLKPVSSPDLATTAIRYHEVHAAILAVCGKNQQFIKFSCNSGWDKGWSFAEVWFRLPVAVEGLGYQVLSER